MIKDLEIRKVKATRRPDTDILFLRLPTSCRLVIIDEDSFLPVSVAIRTKRLHISHTPFL